MVEQNNGPSEILNGLSDFVGQAEIVREIRRKVLKASNLGLPFPHSLFSGPPDSGKATLGRLVAREMGVGYQVASASDLKTPADIVPYLTNAEERSILVIEGVHSLPGAVCDFLVPVVEGYRLDMTLGEGVNSRTVSMVLKRFTLIGTTSKPSRVRRDLSSSLTAYDFRPYTDEEFERIAGIMALNNGLALPLDSVRLVISCCKGPLSDVALSMKRIRSQVGERADLATDRLREILDLLGYGGERAASVTSAEKLRRMGAREFEKFVGRLFQRQGYRVEFTGASGDHGVDLLLHKNNTLIAAQCKRRKRPDGSVGEPIVRDFYGSMINCGADSGIIITTGFFTSQAIAFAANKPILLMDIDALLRAAQGVSIAGSGQGSLFR